MDPNGSKIGPVKMQVQFWIRSGPVPERSRVNRRPIRSDFRAGSIWILMESVPCKHSQMAIVFLPMDWSLLLTVLGALGHKAFKGTVSDAMFFFSKSSKLSSRQFPAMVLLPKTMLSYRNYSTLIPKLPRPSHSWPRSSAGRASVI